MERFGKPINALEYELALEKAVFILIREQEKTGHYYASDENLRQEIENIPSDRKRKLIHSFLTVRNPSLLVSLELENSISIILSRELSKKEVTEGKFLPSVLSLFSTSSEQSSIANNEFLSKVSLWKGDITLLQVDAIVNAANSHLVGCFQVSHRCIDSIIHSKAGPKLRESCQLLMEKRNFEEQPVGSSQLTAGFQLPSKYVIHSVGPNLNIEGRSSMDPTEDEIIQLSSCYKSCLDVAFANDLKSIAFCCISTGLFGFSQEKAASIAVETVKKWLEEHPNYLERIIFNVFKSEDECFYRSEFEKLAGKSIFIHSSNSNLTISKELKLAAEWLRSADSIVFAGGAGLSASAGLDYNSEKIFKELFPAMYKRGFRCMYEFIGYHDWTPELQWGYLLSQVNLARFQWGEADIYQNLKSIGNALKDRYFVITSNADGFFYQNGFPEEKIFTPQGSYAHLQCFTPCSSELFPIKPFIDAAVPFIDSETQELTDLNLIPKCKNCGGTAFLNVRGGDWFVEDSYQDQKKKYQEFLQNSIEESEKNGKLFVLLEIGVGFNTPSVIRWPLEKITQRNSNVRLIRINALDAEIPLRLEDRAVGIAADASEIIKYLLNSLSK